jgi:nucleoside-diphosphate-sugar epimerase
MTKSDGKKILITGATGFIGSNLARFYVGQKAEVHILRRATSNDWRIRDILEDIKVHDADLTDYDRLKATVSSIKPEIILHTAVYGGHSTQKDLTNVINANFIGTINLLNACSSIDYERFVNTGSSSEYGIKVARMNENDVCEPIEEYGVTKAAASMYCRMLAGKDKKPIITLRLFSPYGYYDDASRLIPSVILSCLSQKAPSVSSPDFVRDFIFIDDILDAYARAVDAPLKGREIINVGSGHQSAIGETVTTIIRLMGDHIQPEWGNAPKRSNEPKKWEADIGKARELLGWAPAYGMEKGLKKTIEWFKDHRAFYEG